MITNTNQVYSPFRTVLARVELYNGSTLASTYTQSDFIKSFSIERTAEENKFFGFGICQKTNIKLIDKDRKINITTNNSFKHYLSTGSGYISSFPKFYTTEVHRDENTNELSITAYDALYEASAHYLNELALNPPYTVEAVAETCADFLGLAGIKIIGAGATETCFTANYANGANFSKEVDEEGNETIGKAETIRQVLNAIAEATQTIYYIDNSESLVFKRLDREGEAVLTISKNDYFTLKSGENRRLSTICRATELGNNISESITAEGSTQYLWDNPFWEVYTEEEIATLVSNALTAIGGLTINQFECSWRGNHYLEIGDKIALITKDNNTVYSFLIDDTLEYTGALTQETRWSYEESEREPSNPTNLGDKLNLTYARVDKVNQEIKIVRETADTTAEILFNEDGIVSRVNSFDGDITELEEAVGELDENYKEIGRQVEAKVSEEDFTVKVSTVLEGENEVGGLKVKNTNFVFDNEGLTISKSGYEMETHINEDGMAISKGSEEVLTVNNEGVSAIDLHAQTYMIVGKYSRFEDYGNKRTACFWIGG